MMRAYPTMQAWAKKFIESDGFLLWVRGEATNAYLVGLLANAVTERVTQARMEEQEDAGGSVALCRCKHLKVVWEGAPTTTTPNTGNSFEILPGKSWLT